MPSVTLSSLIGGAGVSEVSFYSGSLQIPSGSSGDLVVITPPSGKRVVLNTLCGGTETGMTVSGSSVGSVITSLTMNTTSSAAGTFQIAAGSSTTTINNNGYINQLVFGINEAVTITKDTGSTAIILYYSYAYGS